MNTMNGDANLFTERYKDISGGGFKGYQFGIHYVLAKNMVLGLEYYNLKGISNSDFTAKTFWSEIQVYFWWLSMGDVDKGNIKIGVSTTIRETSDLNGLVVDN